MNESLPEKNLRKEYQEKKQVINNLKIQLRSLNAEKETEYKELKRLKDTIFSKTKQIKELKQDRDSFTQQVKELKTQRETVNQVVKEKSEIKKTVEAKKKELTQHTGVTDSPASLRTQIQRLERNLETEVMAFTKEQQLQKKIKEFKAKLKQLENVDEIWKEVNTASADFAQQCRKAQEYHKEIQEKAQLSQQKHDQICALYEEIKKLREQEKPLAVKVSQKKQQIDELRKQIDELQPRVTELANLLHEEGEKSFKKKAQERTAEVAEKIKNRKKLSTEDILAFQAMKE